MKYEYMKFIKWEGKHALFKKANIIDKIICSIGLNPPSFALNIKKGKIIILIKVPKDIFKLKGRKIFTLNLIKPKNVKRSN